MSASYGGCAPLFADGADRDNSLTNATGGERYLLDKAERSRQGVFNMGVSPFRWLRRSRGCDCRQLTLALMLMRECNDFVKSYYSEPACGIFLNL